MPRRRLSKFYLALGVVAACSGNLIDDTNYATLAVVVTGSGNGSVTDAFGSQGGQIDCRKGGGDCSGSYDLDHPITGVKFLLRGAPDPGSVLVRWQGDCAESRIDDPAGSPIPEVADLSTEQERGLSCTVEFAILGPASLVKGLGDGQSAAVGAAIPFPNPTVLLRDQRGDGVGNVPVTFTVTLGGGTVTSASPLTSGAGIASVGSWTLGALGVNELTATVAGLPPVVFTARGTPATPTPEATTLADTYIQGGASANTNFGTADVLLVKGNISNLDLARKTYLAIDLAPLQQTGFTKAELVLTLASNTSDPNPPDLAVYGIIDNDDWKPDLPGTAETEITWTNAPRNDPTSAIGFAGQGSTPGSGVRQLLAVRISATDPAGSVYRFDVTEYAKWALGRNGAFSAMSPAGDTDRIITILLAHQAATAVTGGPVYRSRENTTSSNRPRLEVF